MATILQTTFADIFSCMKIGVFWITLLWNFLDKEAVKEAIIGSDNGLVPTKQQTIIWTNDGMYASVS